MPKLTNVEKAEIRAAARVAARAEAEAALADGWRMPQVRKVCKRLGRCGSYLKRHPWLADVVEAEFELAIKRQCDAIVAEAKVMLAERKAGRLVGVMGLSELERRLGIKQRRLVQSASFPSHRFHKARKQCLKLWAKAKGRPAPTPAPAVKQEFCRCCNTRILNSPTINGFLPECWEEKQRWEAIDEGRLSRLSA